MEEIKITKNEIKQSTRKENKRKKGKKKSRLVVKTSRFDVEVFTATITFASY